MRGSFDRCFGLFPFLVPSTPTPFPLIQMIPAVAPPHFPPRPCQVIPAVAALPNPSLQWPQLVAFAQDFDLCPSLIPWATLARMVCFAGDCALPHRWQAPDSHGLARGCACSHVF